VTIENSIRQYRLAQEVSRMRRVQATSCELEYLPASNTRQYRLMQQYPFDEEPLLLCGEKGVGKEALARAYHRQTARRYKPFISINCAPLAETQAWSILFGGTKNSSEGEPHLSSKLSSAIGGTLYLNGIDNLSNEAQSHLVDMIHFASNRVCARGDSSHHGIRLVGATQLQVDELESSKRLDAKLLEYMNHHYVELPPLRYAPEDIESLAYYYTERFALPENPMVQAISTPAVELLQTYDWPENILEFERLMFRAILLCEDTQLEVDHLLPYLPLSYIPQQQGHHKQGIMMRSGRLALTNDRGEVRRLRDLEVDMIHFALDFYDGRISEVARKLGIGRSTLYRKLHDLDIKVA